MQRSSRLPLWLHMCVMLVMRRGMARHWPLRLTRWASVLVLVSCVWGISPGWGATPDFQAGVQAYRQGQYQQAQQIFNQLHAQHPHDSRATYYLAISEAQLGRFEQARTLYQKIILLDPQSEAAHLAREGLQYLPAGSLTALDQPPRFMQAGQQAGHGVMAMTPGGGFQNGASSGGASGAQVGGMSPQDWMMMQMMMGQQAGGQAGGGGMNPMWLMMPGMMGQAGGDGGQNLDPNVLSNMMMNQMMQNFSLFGEPDSR